MIVQQLPPRLLSGRTVWVHSANCVEIALDLGFGITAQKAVIIEGVQNRDIPTDLKSEAKHCLVTLLGGKRVLVLCETHRKDAQLLGRVYLNEKVYGDPVGLAAPYPLNVPLLEIGTFFNWLSTTKYDIQRVKAVLNGTGSKKRVEVASGAA